MSYSSLQDLLDFLNKCIVGNPPVFTLEVGKIGSPAIDDLIVKYLSQNGKSLVVNKVTSPQIIVDQISFEGEIDTLLGLTPAYVGLEFDLNDNGAPSLSVSLSPLSDKQPEPVKDWNLGTAYPVWTSTKSTLIDLSFDTPVFYISSIARKSTKSRPAISAGLNFTAIDLKYTGLLSILNNFPEDLQFKNLTGVISNTSTAPYLTLVSESIQPIPIDYLNLPIQFSAISEKYQDRGTIPSSPPDISSYLQLSTSIGIGKVSIPIKMEFNGIGAVVTLMADLEQVNNYAIEEFDSLINKAPIGNYLQEYVNIGKTVGLKDLGIVLSTKPFGLSAIFLDLGTTAPLTVIEKYVEIPDINVNFWVDDPQGTKNIQAILSGTFQFINVIPVNISAVFPQLVFSGGIEQNSNLTIDKIFQQFIPSVKHLPDVQIANLFIAADLKNKLYNFNLDITSSWKIPVGIAYFQLEEALIELGYQSGGAGFSGSISAKTILYNQSQTEILSLYADWTLPGDFLIKGIFPKINLSDLASTLTGGYLSDTNGLPEIILENSVIELTVSKSSPSNYYLGYYHLLQEDTTNYDFSLSTEIDVSKIGKADLFFEVKKDTNGTGFVTGLVVQPDWTPADIWSGLADVFKVLTIQEAGLILSSLEIISFEPPNFQNLPYKPDQIKPGITFFSQLELKGDTFSLIQKLFATDIDFQLYAFINPKDITQSEIKAMLPGSQGKGILTFNGLVIDLKPGAGEFSISASAILRIEQEQLTLIGSGSIQLVPPNVTFIIDLHCWKHPFGIKGLTIVDFGLSVGISEIVTLGLLGNFLIGEGDDQFKFLVGGEIIDFEAPGAFVFGLDDANPEKPLKVTDLIKQFTALDLSEVPLLNGLAFKNLEFYVVDDPNGWKAPNGHCYQTGIGIDADILFYSYEIKFFLEVNWTKGIIANGSINKPIEILDIVVISDATGKMGPNAAIDTTNLTSVQDKLGLPPEQWYLADPSDDCSDNFMDRILYHEPVQFDVGCNSTITGFLPITVLTSGDQSSTYFSFSGGLKILGLTETFSGSATKDGFEVNFYADLVDLFRAQFMCKYAQGKSLEGSAKGNFDFNMDFPNGLTIDGIPILPPFSIHGPYASLDIEVALNLSDPFLSFDLDFDWGSFHINPNFKIDAKAVVDLLSNLWNHIKDWINNNLKTFFKDLLDNVGKYVEEIAHGVLKLGMDAYFVAKALFEHFGQDITECAKYLYKVIEFGFNEVVDALVKVFKASVEEVLKIMYALGEDCAVAAGGQIVNAPIENQ